MKCLFKNDLSTVSKTNNQNEYHILRSRELKNVMDDGLDEIWIEVTEERGMHYLTIEIEGIEKTDIWPVTAINNGWLTYEETCALPIEILHPCDQCGQLVDLRELHPESVSLPTQNQRWSCMHIHCDTDERAWIRLFPDDAQ